LKPEVAFGDGWRKHEQTSSEAYSGKRSEQYDRKEPCLSINDLDPHTDPKVTIDMQYQTIGSQARVITLKYQDRCVHCGQVMNVDETAWWKKGVGVWHRTGDCQPKRRLDGGSGRT
jgi:hypothetical protein